MNHSGENKEMNKLTDEDIYNKAHSILIESEGFEQKISDIKKHYLALLGNPNYSDCSSAIIAKKAIEHYDAAEFEITNAIIEKFIEERF